MSCFRFLRPKIKFTFTVERRVGELHHVSTVSATVPDDADLDQILDAMQRATEGLDGKPRVTPDSMSFKRARA